MMDPNRTIKLFLNPISAVICGDPRSSALKRKKHGFTQMGLGFPQMNTA